MVEVTNSSNLFVTYTSDFPENNLDFKIRLYVHEYKLNFNQNLLNPFILRESKSEVK